MTVPTVTLNNGVEMPILGFGVYQIPLDETQAAVEAALSAGYRHVDTDEMDRIATLDIGGSLFFDHRNPDMVEALVGTGTAPPPTPS